MWRRQKAARLEISRRQELAGGNTGRRRNMPTLDYRAHLLEDLKNPEYAAGYLTAALEEGEDVFLLAVRDVVDAHGGIGRLSESTSLNRENLHQILSQRGNPRFSSLMSILRELGVEIQFRAKPCDMTAV
jgi:probable addiction module antidote protein